MVGVTHSTRKAVPPLRVPPCGEATVDHPAALSPTREESLQPRVARDKPACEPRLFLRGSSVVFTDARPDEVDHCVRPVVVELCFTGTAYNHAAVDHLYDQGIVDVVSQYAGFDPAFEIVHSAVDLWGEKLVPHPLHEGVLTCQ